MKKSNVKNLRIQSQKVMRHFASNDYQTPCGIKISSSSAHVLLLLLKVKDEAVNQQILARELNLNKSSIARTCTELEENGHIKIGTDRDDRRNNIILLTDKGLKLANKLDSQGDMFFSSILQNIPLNKVEEVLACLEILNEAFELATKKRKEK